jgi:hypothetical protein
MSSEKLETYRGDTPGRDGGKSRCWLRLCLEGVRK